jgi:hypothetical protein
LLVLRELVTAQYLDNIASIDKALIPRFESAGMGHYHKHSHLLEHEKVWPKLKRCLPQESCDRIKGLDFWKKICEDLSWEFYPSL